MLARRTGADALILKPFLASALRTKIEQITVSKKLAHLALPSA